MDDQEQPTVIYPTPLAGIGTWTETLGKYKWYLIGAAALIVAFMVMGKGKGKVGRYTKQKIDTYDYRE